MSDSFDVLDSLELRPGGALPGDVDWLPEDALTLCSEDIDELSATQVLHGLASARQLRARADAIESQLLARFDAIRGGRRGTEAEAAYELRISRHSAADRITQARQLVRRHPRLLRAMHEGLLEAHAAGRVLDLTAHLTDELARQVDARLEPRLPGKNADGIQRAARRILLDVDPDGMAHRARAARAERNVTLRTGEDTMSRLIADLPAEIAAAAYGSLDEGARRLRRHGDERTLDQLRADLLGQRLIHPGGTSEAGEARQTSEASPADEPSNSAEPSGPSDATGCGGTCQPSQPRPASPSAGTGAQVFLHMPIDAALAITDDGCELEGYGPIPGPIARHIMSDPASIWRKVICDPATGAVLDLGRSRYRPNATIREVVNARDRVCCIPDCYRPAHHCDFDHRRSHANNGDTSVDNGGPACEYHNNLKEEPGWKIDFHDNAYTITTPTGRTYTRKRQPILKPKPPPQPPPPEPPPEHPPF